MSKRTYLSDGPTTLPWPAQSPERKLHVYTAPAVLLSSDSMTWVQPGTWLGVTAAAPFTEVGVPDPAKAPSHIGVGGRIGITPSVFGASYEAEAQAAQALTIAAAMNILGTTLRRDGI